jgi:ZIP family zinc transporter
MEGIDPGNFWFAFGLTAMAGLSTGIGGLLALFARRTNTRFLSVALGFSAGVMIYVSMIEILPKAMESLVAEMGNGAGMSTAVAAFFGGMLFIAIIDKLVPSAENPHETHTVEEMDDPASSGRHNHRLMRMGAMTALAIAIHNFPEGLATFLAAMHDPALGVPIAIAIALHNIPEGIAVAVPVYYATGSRIKAFWYSFLSGLAEPIGALVGYVVLLAFVSEAVMGIAFAAVGGIMVFISLDGLLPAAREFGEHHLSMYGVVSGMIMMAVSLVLLG